MVAVFVSYSSCFDRYFLYAFCCKELVKKNEGIENYGYKDGKIDMILTKSVSRFARNMVDSLLTIRKLKEKNVAVVFEKEGVNTLDGTGEILITILSSLAQEESRSISENTRWGVVRRFENGKMIVNHNKYGMIRESSKCSGMKSTWEMPCCRRPIQ